MNQDFNKFKCLIEIMESEPKLQPPEGLSEKIMMRLAVEERHDLWRKSKGAISDFLVGRYHFGWSPKLTVSSPRECSYCFFMTGFFYLVMGIILMVGFKTISSSFSATDWIKLQPYVTLSTAIWLLALGGILIMESRTAFKIARFGTLLYIFCTVSNGVLMSSYLHIPYAGIIMTGFIVAGIVMGTMLALAVENLEFRPV